MDVSLEARFAAIVKVLLRSDLVEYDELVELEESAVGILTEISGATSEKTRDSAIEGLVEFLKGTKDEGK